MRQLASAEYGALAVAAGPVTAAVVGWLLRQLMLHLRDARARAYVGQLVAWAEQALPEKSSRYRGAMMGGRPLSSPKNRRRGVGAWHPREPWNRSSAR